MTDTIIHVGDVGTVIRLTVTEKDGTTPINVSTATDKTFYFRKPDGTKINRVAAFDSDGVDGKLKYIIVDGDIETVGKWQVQAFVEIWTSKYYSAKVTFSVQSNLA